MRAGLTTYPMKPIKPWPHHLNVQGPLHFVYSGTKLKFEGPVGVVNLSYLFIYSFYLFILV